MRKLTEFSVKYPITVLMMVLGILLLGYISFQKLGIDLLPALNTPRLFVELEVGERPPEEIEIQFTKNIEALVSRLKKVTRVTSITKVGVARITVEYAWDADMDEAFLDLQKSLNVYSQSSEIDELNITQQDPNAQPVMILGFSRKDSQDLDELRRMAENYLENELIRLEGIASVELVGGEEREVTIETDPYLLEAYSITSSQVANKINSYNRSISSGSIIEMGSKYIIKGVSEYQSLEDIQNIILDYKQPESSATGTSTTQTTATDTDKRIPIYLKELAKVQFSKKEPVNIVHVNQKRCMALGIYKETKYNTVRAVEQVEENLERLQNSLPGYELVVIKNQANFINSAISEVQQTALIGILLAVIILYVFLRRFGVTFIISAAIPISIVATFNLMYFNDLSLNIMTLGGLALGAGMLVDNAIVVVENIFRLLEQGRPLRDAVVEGTSQVAGAITSSTLTTIVVFLPIVYLHGAAGELFKDQAWTVAFSLISSLFVAMLIIPVLSVRVMKKSVEQNLVTSKSVQIAGYRNFLEKIFNHKAVVLLITLVLVILAVLALPFVGSEFLPHADQGEFTIEIQLPEGTDLFRTEGAIINIEHIVLNKIGDVVHTIYSEVGPSDILSSGTSESFEGENTAKIFVILKKERQQTVETLINQISPELAAIPDLEVRIIPEQTALQITMGVEGAPLVVEIAGEDLEQLRLLADQVRDQLREIPDLINLASSFDEGRPEVNISIDRMLAGAWNISIDEISTQLQDFLSGREATQWEHEGEMIDITLKFPKIGLNQLSNLTFTTSSNQKVILSQLATISISNAPKEIFRTNQNRIGQVTAHIRSDAPFDHVVKKVSEQLKTITWPPDYNYEITGQEQRRKEAFENLKFALILALALVYMVLASQFESLLHPFVILLTVPMAGIGPVFLFLVLGQPFNIMSYIGLIMLAGIAVNDSIILVDAINQRRRSGLPKLAAIYDAAEMRIRPIIMTSLTTILALLPLSIGIGEGAALRAPMALAVIGGLITSTLLTLIVIPVIYYLVDRKEDIV
ncbi:efflux RND transporter permease subunit [candidate division KSB1 bacterium]|nr:efflux RND transporter permease subunit [candidate division KSB1 bacterium]